MVSPRNFHGFISTLCSKYVTYGWVNIRRIRTSLISPFFAGLTFAELCCSNVRLRSKDIVTWSKSQLRPLCHVRIATSHENWSLDWWIHYLTDTKTMESLGLQCVLDSRTYEYMCMQRSHYRKLTVYILTSVSFISRTTFFLLIQL